MNPARVKDATRRMIEAAGTTARFETADGLSSVDDVRVRNTGLSESEIAGAQGRNEIRIIAYADDFGDFGEPEKGNLMLIGDDEYSIEYVDKTTRVVQGVIIAYEMRAAN